MIKQILINFQEYTSGTISYYHSQVAQKFLNNQKLKYEAIVPRNGLINLRTIKCSCNNPKCEIGISFDSNENETKHVMRFHDKWNLEHNIELNKENVQQLIKNLRTIQQQMK